MKWVGAILVFLVAGCGSGSNQQKEPIGSRCKKNSDCGTSPFQCETTGYPGGYCDKICTTDGDCPLDSLCLPKPSSVCRRRCESSTECRTDVADGIGYACITSEGATGSFCDVKALTMSVDLGPAFDM